MTSEEMKKAYPAIMNKPIEDLINEVKSLEESIYNDEKMLYEIRERLNTNRMIYKVKASILHVRYSEVSNSRRD